jgi:hypothetical protein
MAMVRGVSAPPEAAVAAVGLRKVYGQGGTSVVALNDVDVTFPRGQFTAIMGPSGSGEVHPAALPGRTRHALRLSMISGRSQGLAGGAFVSAELARSYGLSVGERITVRWPRGGEGVRTVTGVYRGSSLVPGVLVPQQVALPHLEQTGASVAFVALAPPRGPGRGARGAGAGRRRPS